MVAKLLTRIAEICSSHCRSGSRRRLRRCCCGGGGGGGGGGGRGGAGGYFYCDHDDHHDSLPRTLLMRHFNPADGLDASLTNSRS